MAGGLLCGSKGGEEGRAKEVVTKQTKVIHRVASFLRYLDGGALGGSQQYTEGRHDGRRRPTIGPHRAPTDDPHTQPLSLVTIYTAE